jgi:ubiquinol-cytochrome c reductase cytochrome b subunit
VGGATLNRFFSLHYLMPFMIAGVVALHIWALHVPGNNNPTGVDVKSKADTVPFHPYYTVKDGFAISAFLILFAWFVFFAPEALGHTDNQVPANPLVTPAHIVPEWYFLPFYAILRSVPQKLFGVLAMFGSIALLFVTPWLDTSKVRSMRYRPTARIFFLIFVAVTIMLGWCGGKEPDDVVIAIGKTANGDPTGFSVVWFSRILAIYYYAYFLVVLPVLGLRETTLPVPVNISTPVLSGGAAMPVGALADAEKKG